MEEGKSGKVEVLAPVTGETLGFVGKMVIVRSHMSGVWYGLLVESPVPDGEGSVRCFLGRARRVHYWEGAGSCSGLAEHGPKSGRIAVPVTAMISGICEILGCEDAAVKQFDSLPEWRP